MPLDAALEHLLHELAIDQSFVRPTDTNLAGARRAHEEDARRFTPPAGRPGVAKVEDIEILSAAESLRLRVYRPEETGTPLPTIIWFHGGGWTTGSLDTGDIIARALCQRTPAVVVSVDYRLSPERPWPAATDDAATALAWVAEHIGELGGADDLIAVGGDSAGGNIAAVLAQQARTTGPALAGQILLYPVLDLAVDRDDCYPSLRDNAVGYYVTTEDLRWCVNNYLAGGGEPSDPRISPILEANLQGVPATVLAVAEYDPLRDQGAPYVEALRTQGIEAVLHEGSGLIHGAFDMLGTSLGARLEFDRILDSVQQLLCHPAHMPALEH